MPGMMRWSCSRGCCVRDDRASEKRDWQRTEWAQTEDIEVVSCDADCPCPWGIDVYIRTTVVQGWAAATQGMVSRS
jgi:hypothetical protein